MKGISTFALLARSSFYKILAVIVLMIFAEGVLFYRALGVYGGSRMAPEAKIEDSFVPIAFLAGLGAVYLILVWTESRMALKSSYTLMRLRITEYQFFWIKTVYNLLCLIFVFVVQIWLAMLMIGIYSRKLGAEYTSPQIYFLTFYRNEFLHCLLPMAEIGKWVRNILMILAFGMSAAGSRASKKGDGKGSVPTASSTLYLVACCWFVTDMGMNVLDMFCNLFSVIAIGLALLKAHRVISFSEEE